MKSLVALLFICICLLISELQTDIWNDPHKIPIPLGLDLHMPVPEENLPTKEKIELGEKLFFDSRLSKDLTVSCASCHKPEFGFADTSAVSIGIDAQTGLRNVPTLINRAYGRMFSWDGRAQTLEEQVLLPISNPIEMDMNIDELVKRLQEIPEYKEAFRRTYDSGVTVEGISFALSTYIRTILSGNSIFDLYMHGETDTFPPPVLRGLQLFRGKANCTNCHVGPNFTDEQFHNTGVAFTNSSFADKGRYRITEDESDTGVFKTPTLREIEHTPPYMHDGNIKTLEEVIEFYNRGGNPNPYLSNEVEPLDLTDDEKRDLIEFLRSLSGEGWR
ncbi:MAG: cytochrome-c peroxidase [Balneolaceae bacterium]